MPGEATPIARSERGSSGAPCAAASDAFRASHQKDCLPEEGCDASRSRSPRNARERPACPRQQMVCVQRASTCNRALPWTDLTTAADVQSANWPAERPVPAAILGANMRPSWSARSAVRHAPGTGPAITAIHWSACHSRQQLTLQTRSRGGGARMVTCVFPVSSEVAPQGP